MLMAPLVGFEPKKTKTFDGVGTTSEIVKADDDDAIAAC
jgi:hypothetical protein